jgi:hypothetical protein
VETSPLRYVPDTNLEAVQALAADEWNKFADGDLPQPVLIRLRQAPDGRLVCTGLIIGAVEEKEISGRDLRRISLPDVLELVDAETAARTKSQGWKAYIDRPRAAPISTDTSYSPPTLRPAAGWPREHFEQVARAYRANLVMHPFAPLKALARQLGTTEPTARRWVLRARDMGFLGRPLPGKAGGIIADEEETQVFEIHRDAVEAAVAQAPKRERKSRPVKGGRR